MKIATEGCMLKRSYLKPISPNNCLANLSQVSRFPPVKTVVRTDASSSSSGTLLNISGEEEALVLELSCCDVVVFTELVFPILTGVEDTEEEEEEDDWVLEVFAEEVACTWVLLGAESAGFDSKEMNTLR